MPQEAKNGDFRELFPISTPSFPTTCMGFEPPKAITLHLIVFNPHSAGKSRDKVVLLK
jgi:hypothetical protein